MVARAGNIDSGRESEGEEVTIRLSLVKAGLINYLRLSRGGEGRGRPNSAR